MITDGTGILDVRLGADDDPEPERHPCAQFFQTCCFEKSEEPNIVPVEKREGCGWRNPKGIAFELKERNGESQYGEEFLHYTFFFIIYHRLLIRFSRIPVDNCGDE